MSGIFGICTSGRQPIETGRLEALARELDYRGAFGSTITAGQFAGFGCRRLEPEGSAAPGPVCLLDPAARLAIAADCRLDQRAALLDALGDNRELENAPDGSLILEAYRRWSTGCVERLLGDFAFAIWDLEARRLFCARDHLGIKPFYYRHQRDNFVFAPEAEAIAACIGLDTPLNQVRLADHLTPHLEGYDQKATFYTTIHRLPPAHTLLVEDGTLEWNRYWRPEPGPPSTLGENETIECFSELLQRAVADRCRGVNRAGVLLSGGIDSAAVTGFARKILADDPAGSLFTFSGIEDDVSGCVESQMITRICQNHESASVFYRPSELEGETEQLFDLLAKLREPFDIYMVLVLALYRKAAKMDCRVVLDGLDGDLTLSLSPGYPAELVRSGRLIDGFRETLAQARGYYGGRVSGWRQLGRQLRSGLAPQWLRKLLQERRSGKAADEVISNSPINPRFAEAVDLRRRLISFDRQQFEAATRSAFPAGRYLRGLVHPYLTCALERYNRIGALGGIEPRHPLLDLRLLEFFATLPWDLMVRNGWTKYLLRTVAGNHLPPEVCWRSGKEHLGWRFTETLLQKNVDKISDMISDDCKFLRNIINYEIAIGAESSYNTGTNRTIRPEIAGLALWLHRRNAEQADSGTEQDHSERWRPQKIVSATKPPNTR